MSLNNICENKTLAKISEFTVNKDNFNTNLVSLDRALTYRKQ